MGSRTCGLLLRKPSDDDAAGVQNFSSKNDNATMPNDNDNGASLGPRCRRCRLGRQRTTTRCRKLSRVVLSHPFVVRCEIADTVRAGHVQPISTGAPFLRATSARAARLRERTTFASG